MKPVFKLPLIFACIGLFFLQPIFVRMLTTDELGLNIYTALFGVLITAFITYILLQGQAQQQQEVEKSTKAYAEKLTLFKGFFRDLMQIYDNYLRKREISQKEINGLIVLFSKISIHLNTENLSEISKALKEIFEKVVKSENESKIEDDSRRERSEHTMSRSLLRIANIFRKELYGDAQGHVNTEKKESAMMEILRKVFRCKKKEKTSFDEIIKVLENLEASVDVDGSPNEQDTCEHSGVLAPTVTESEVLSANNLSDENCTPLEEKGSVTDKIMDEQQCISALLDTAKEDFFSIFNKEDGWKSTPEPFHTRNALYAKCLSDIPEIGHIMIGFDSEGGAEGPFLQCHLEFKNDELRRACYLAMRREFGGRINKWSWWKPFPKEWALRIHTNPTDTELRNYIIETIKKVYQWVLGYKKMMTLYSKYNSSILESPDISGWKPGIWSNFIWNFFHSTSPLYIDVDYAKDSMDLQVWISNRNHNVEELKAQLTSVLHPGFELNAPLKDEPHWHRYGQYKSEDEVVRVLKELLPKLASMKS